MKDDSARQATESEGPVLISVRELSKSFGANKVLREISLDIRLKRNSRLAGSERGWKINIPEHYRWHSSGKLGHHDAQRSADRFR